MLTPRDIQTHHRAALLVMLLAHSAVAFSAASRVGSGDVREGYERADYRSQSAMLDTSAGKRMALAELAAKPPLGLPELPTALDEAAIDLGRQLFFERRLSANATLSCGMCHVPEQGFTQNELATPVGIEGSAVRRNTPSLYNVAFAKSLFHDGRESRLERQIWEPLLAPNEMGNSDRASVLQRIARLDDYAQKFARVYAQGLTEETFGAALAAYQMGLLSGASRFDQWYFGADQLSLGARERAGFDLFKAKGCSSCHTIGDRQALFTNGEYYNTGIGYRAQAQAAQPTRVQLAPGVFVEPSIAIEVPRLTDEGRFEVTGQAQDRWRYRTPGLRNVALTAPYMHDGSLPSLASVIDYYDQGGSRTSEQDPRIQPLELAAQEKAALLAFLHTLTGNNVAALAADARSVMVGDTRSGRPN